MNKTLLLISLLSLILLPHLISEDKKYDLGPESKVQEGVPQGKITDHVWKSQVFKGTIRHYSIYVPAQYNGEETAIMVFQDGHSYLKSFKAPIVLDNLIHKKRSQHLLASSSTLDLKEMNCQSQNAGGNRLQRTAVLNTTL